MAGSTEADARAVAAARAEIESGHAPDRIASSILGLCDIAERALRDSARLDAIEGRSSVVDAVEFMAPVKMWTVSAPVGDTTLREAIDAIAPEAAPSARFDSAFDIGFSIQHGFEDPTQIPVADLRKALLARIDTLDRGGESHWRDALGYPFDHVDAGEQDENPTDTTP